MREKILKLIGLIEHELEAFYEANRLGDDEKKDVQDLREAAEWLKQNLDYIIADAEYGERL